MRSALVLGCIATATVARADVAVVIDDGKPHQTMQGFGATTISLVFEESTEFQPAPNVVGLGSTSKYVAGAYRCSAYRSSLA